MFADYLIDFGKEGQGYMSNCQYKGKYSVFLTHFGSVVGQ